MILEKFRYIVYRLFTIISNDLYVITFGVTTYYKSMYDQLVTYSLDKLSEFSDNNMIVVSYFAPVLMILVYEVQTE